MPGANGPLWLLNKEAIRTGRLVTVMFYDEWFAREPSNEHRQEAGSSDMRNVRVAHQASQ